MADPLAPSEKIHWFARLEHRIHVWRERRARRRGRVATIVPFPSYASERWVRVLGRVLIVKPRRRTASGDLASVRGWRTFLGVPVSFATVTVRIGDQTFDVVADRGGVVDTVVAVPLEPGWQKFTMSVEGHPPVEARTFVVADDVTFGIVSDVDDTVMVTALPRPLIAAWNSFVVDEHARVPVPGMSVLLEQLARDHPGSPVIYLSTGAWNVAPTLTRFLGRNLFPSGALLLTDWGPTHDRWFRSGREHKRANLRRLAEEFPQVKWLLIGDDGQHDESVYSTFASEHPDSIAGIAIRNLLPAEAVLAGGRSHSDRIELPSVPRVHGPDGASIRKELREAGLIN